MVGTSLKRRIQSLEAFCLPGETGPKYIVLKVIDASKGAVEQTDADCKAVRIGDQVVYRIDGETVDQLCDRAHAAHGGGKFATLWWGQIDESGRWPWESAQEALPAD